MQVKNACVNCQRACKKCDDSRPCQRCVKSNIQETCKDSTRKPRQRGIKRGPYKKRKLKSPPKSPSSSPPPEPAMGTFDSSLEPSTPQRYQRPAPLSILSDVALTDRQILTPRYISASPSSFFLGPKHIPFSASRFDDTYRQQKSNPVSPMLSSRRRDLEDDRGYQSAGSFEYPMVDKVDEPSEMRIRRLSRILGNSRLKNY